jgi:hypothetical protein
VVVFGLTLQRRREFVVLPGGVIERTGKREGRRSTLLLRGARFPSYEDDCELILIDVHKPFITV